MTSDGRPYGAWKYAQDVKSCFIISKNSATSYTDVRDKMTPSEVEQIIGILADEAKKQKENLDKIKKEREEKRLNHRGR